MSNGGPNEEYPDERAQSRASVASTAEFAGVVENGEGKSASFTATLSYNCTEKGRYANRCDECSARSWEECPLDRSVSDGGCQEIVDIKYAMTVTENDDDDDDDDADDEEGLACILNMLAVDEYSNDGQYCQDTHGVSCSPLLARLLDASPFANHFTTETVNEVARGEDYCIPY